MGDGYDQSTFRRAVGRRYTEGVAEQGTTFRDCSASHQSASVVRAIDRLLADRGPLPPLVQPRSSGPPPPALFERRHRSLARRLVAVGCALDAVGTVAACPHPRAALRPDC